MELSHLDGVVDLLREALFVTLKVSLPILGIGLLVGLAISLFQAVTQIQEQTLTFIPKILAVVATTIFMMPLLLTWLLEYTREVFERILGGMGS
ncbi:MAG: flagellar biosynthesis protein FliQ [Planctomycetota bacterium]